jgi:hypothetical protein
MNGEEILRKAMILVRRKTVSRIDQADALYATTKD